MTAAAPDPRPQETHAFDPTLGGMCAKCQRPADRHLKLQDPDPMTECRVDHGSLETKQVLGLDGLRWTHCPYCNVMVEAKLATGQPDGPSYGRGRGAITARFEKVLGFYAYLASRLQP